MILKDMESCKKKLLGFTQPTNSSKLKRIINAKLNNK